MSNEYRGSRAASIAQLHYIDGAAQTERMQARMAELDTVHRVESERLGALIASARKMSDAARRIIRK